VFSAVATVAYAQPQIKKEPIRNVNASDAPAMFNSYCAPCHGKDAKGTGPAAKALVKAPADLTTIAKRNGGAFPEVKVKRYIEGADDVSAHGSREMPIWGPLFRELNQDTALLRVQQLNDYIKGMQAK
jgi:mono/diheme cytochrome c family protein